MSVDPPLALTTGAVVRFLRPAARPSESRPAGRPAARSYHRRMGFYTYEFVAPVERHEFKNFGYTCVYFPGSMEDELKLPDRPRLRVAS